MVMHYGTRGLVLASLLASTSFAPACGGGDDSPPEAADSTGAPTTGSSTGGNTISATGMAEGESVDSTGGTSSASGSSSGMADGSFLDGVMSEDGPPPPMEQPNGSMCADETECKSGFCYQLPMLGGVCSECLTDTDCPTGTCSLDPTAGYAICTDGSIGVMCSTDEGCMGDLVCGTLIDTGGLFPLDFCSECNEDTPCPKGQICSPVYNLEMFQGYLACQEPGSVPNDGGCPLEGGMGQGEVCQSGYCGAADVFGIVPIGVCGECLDDMDCMPMEMCSPPVADMSGVQGATCG